MSNFQKKFLKLNNKPNTEKIFESLRNVERYKHNKIYHISFTHGELINIKQDFFSIFTTIYHFDIFVPYGPLPMKTINYTRNEVIQKFVNIINQKFSVLHYRAWSQLNAIVGCDHEDSKNTFLIHLQQISGVSHKLEYNCHIKRLRQAFPGAYLSRNNSLINLSKILNFYFKVPIKIKPNHARLIDHSKKNNDQKLGILGKTRVGSRFFDLQYSAHIEIGPLPSPVYQQYQKESDKLLTLIIICNDFVKHQIIFDVSLIIKTEKIMSTQLGKNFISKDSWLKPDEGNCEQIVYQAIV